MKRLFLVIAVAVGAIPAFGQTVSVKNGNVQFTDKSGATISLTSSGRDSDPILAPDGKWVAFVRKVDGKKIATGSDQVDPTELGRSARMERSRRCSFVAATRRKWSQSSAASRTCSSRLTENCFIS